MKPNIVFGNVCLEFRSVHFIVLETNLEFVCIPLTSFDFETVRLLSFNSANMFSSVSLILLYLLTQIVFHL